MTRIGTSIGIEEDLGPMPVINYTPKPIDEYIVIVNLPEDWETIHNYIINENEIDGIPNRKINCSNVKNFSLRSSIYEMSVEEAEQLRTHEKVECVKLSPYKYPQPVSIDGRNRYDGNIVGFNKLFLPLGFSQFSDVPPYVNGVRSNWGMLNVNHPSSEYWRGIGITSTTNVDTFLKYSSSGLGVDTITIDSGCAVLHPEFIAPDGSYRLKDVVLDGPYMVDPEFFEEPDTNRLEMVTIDGVDIGIRPVEWVARAWWAGTANRSATFSSLDTIPIPATYTFGQAFSKGVSSNPILSGHGTAVTSQIAGKTFGLAFECNPWTIRISIGGGVIDGSTALDVSTIFHNAKKLISTDPNPTLINNSWSSFRRADNDYLTNYYHKYRGTDKIYQGNGSTYVPPNTPYGNIGSALSFQVFAYYTNNLNDVYIGYYTDERGKYPDADASSPNEAAENAIAAGCIVVASAGNHNCKLSDKTDPDFNNEYYHTTLPSAPGAVGYYTNRVGGVTKGFSGDHDVGKGSIRCGLIDNGVEPVSEVQGSTKYSIRKSFGSANGPMVDIFAPGGETLAAGYANDYEDFQRNDNSNFYDTRFGGTSSAAPMTCSVIALYLQNNRGANQSAVRTWLTTTACKNNLLSDPIQSEGNSATDDLTNGYWPTQYDADDDNPIQGTSSPFENFSSTNLRGCGNLRGAPNRVLYNPYSDALDSSVNLNIESSQLTFNGEFTIDQY